MMRRWHAGGLLLLATAAWASTFPAYKYLLVHLHPMELQLWRYALALVLILLLGGWRRILNWRSPDVRHGLLLGLSLWVGFTAQAYGIDRTDASRAAFLTSLLILFGPLIYRVTMGRRLRRKYYLYWGLALLGVGLLTIRDWTWSWNRGDSLCLLGALAFAVQMVGVDRWATPENARQLAFLQIGVITAGTLFWSDLVAAPLHPPGSEQIGTWMLLGFLALVPTWWAFEWQARAQPILQTPVAILIYATEPLQATLLAMVWVGESLQLQQWLGGLLVCTALYGAQRSPIYQNETIVRKKLEAITTA